jgi:hypothetical protein
MKLKTKLLFIAAFLVLALPMVFMGNADAIQYNKDGAVLNPTTGLWELPAVFCTGVSAAYETTGNYAANPGTAVIRSDKNGGNCGTGVSYITYFLSQPACTTEATDGACCRAAGYQWRSGGSYGCYSRAWNYSTDTGESASSPKNFQGVLYGSTDYRACLKCHNKYYMDTAFGGGSHTVRRGDPVAQYVKASHKNASRKIPSGLTAGQGLANVYLDSNGTDEHFGIFPYLPAGAAQTAGPYGTATKYNLRRVDWVNGKIEDTTGGLKNLPTDVYTEWYWEFGYYGEDPERGVYNAAVSANGKPSGGSSMTACFRCHATGYVGLAAPDTTKEPERSFTGISWNGTTTYSSGTRPGKVNLANNLATRVLGTTFNTRATNAYGAWDEYGVVCAKCHNAFDGGHNNGSNSTNATNPDVGLNLPGSSDNVRVAGAKVNAVCGQCHIRASSSDWTVTLSTATPDNILTNRANVGTGHPNYHGTDFLNSPHARFTGTYGQVTDTTKYDSAFFTSFGGCTGCHNPHGSVRETLLDATLMGGASKTAAEGIEEDATCAACHNVPRGSAGAIATINHPTNSSDVALYGEAPGDTADPCVTCHMPSARHLFRITLDTNYTTTQPTLFTTKPDGSLTEAVWVDLKSACGQCHITGIAPHFTTAQLVGAATNMHNTTTAATNAQCLACHTTGVDGAPIITPGTNHHGVHSTCVTCHPNGHNGPLPDASSNAFCLTCHTNTGPYANHHSVSAVTAACNSCHTIPGVTVPPMTTRDEIVAGCTSCHTDIIPSGTGDNHHRGHGTADPPLVGLSCKACHSDNGGKSTTDVSTALGLPAAAHQSAGSEGTISATSKLCVVCHSETDTGHGNFIQSGPGQNHHKGNCVTCHKPDGSHTDGAPGAGVTTPAPATVVDCTQCHTMTFRWNMDPITCEDCHVHAGVKPADSTVCAACHTTGPGKPLTTAQLDSYRPYVHYSGPAPDAYPVAAGTLSCPTGWAASWADASTDDNPGLQVSIIWGDGFNSNVAPLSTTPHTYTKAGLYAVTVRAVDSIGQTTTLAAGTCDASAAATFSVSGKTLKSAGAGGGNLGGVGLVLRNFSTVQSCTSSPVVALKTSASNGDYSFTGLRGGTRYGICATKAGYTFPVPAFNQVMAGNVTQNIQATAP